MKKKNWWNLDFLKQPAVIVAFLAPFFTGVGTVFHLVQSNAEAVANLKVVQAETELKVRKENDKTLTNYVIALAQCK